MATDHKPTPVDVGVWRQSFNPLCARICLVDLSRNRSRRFCSTTCGKRATVAAYRARRSEG